MADELQGKVALVTGASRGIGRAIAEVLGEAGAAVALVARSAEALEQTAEAVKKRGGRALCVPADLADEEAVVRAVATTGEAYGRLDMVVNNAGITLAARLEETQTADWDRVMAVNARGPFLVCREAIGLLRRTGGGIIVNISSVVGVKGYAEQTAYGASKHALRGMSIALAAELKGDNIRVHVICPGGVDTEMVRRVRPDIPQEDLMAPEEIAELVRYLVTHQGNAVIDEIRVRRASSAPWF